MAADTFSAAQGGSTQVCAGGSAFAVQMGSNILNAMNEQDLGKCAAALVATKAAGAAMASPVNAAAGAAVAAATQARTGGRTH